MISRRFWEIHPGLFFASLLLIGELSLKMPFFLLLLPLLFFSFRHDQKKCFLMGALLLMGTTSEKYFMHPSIEGKKEGSGILHIDSIKGTKTSFSRGEVLYGTLKYFEELYNIPIVLFYGNNKPHPRADRDYFVSGSLFQTEEGYYQFKPSKEEWKEVPYSFSFAEKRFEWKKSITNILEEKLSSSHSLSFLIALTTGECHDYVLPILISKLGLSHLFAISGLHFSCLLAFLGLFLFPFFKVKVQSIILILFAIFYSFYLGSSPSLLRAFVSSLILLVGLATYNRSNPLNTLGLALFFLILFYPSMKYSPGFILSFVATFSLIVFYPIMEGLVAIWIRTRCINCFSSLSTLSKQIYLLLHLFKKIIAVNLAISIGTLPLLLYYWHSFPLLSLVYNTFFPTLTLLSLFMTLSALALYALYPPLSTPPFFLLDRYTHSILDLLYYYPREWAFSLHYELPFPLLVISLILWIYFGLKLSDKTTLLLYH